MKIGKYEVMETIRQGAVCLHRAAGSNNKIPVALKTFHCNGVDPQLVSKFRRDVKARATLLHPNIAHIVHVGEENNVLHIATEWLEGEDLEKFFQRKGSLTFEAKLEYVLKTLEGMAFAHDNNAVHGDISPGNIFLTKQGYPKILDFGISRFWYSQFCEEESGEAHSPATPYRAPEQISDGVLDARSDVYSLGVIVSQFLTGSVPSWTAQASSEMSVVQSGTPESLAQIIHKATAKDPSARFRNAAEFLSAFRKFLFDMNRQRTKTSIQIRKDCQLISKLLAELNPDLESDQVRDRLKKSAISPDLLEQIRKDPSAQFALKMDYLELHRLCNDLDKTGAALADIVKKTHGADTADLPKAPSSEKINPEASQHRSRSAGFRTSKQSPAKEPGYSMEQLKPLSQEKQSEEPSSSGSKPDARKQKVQSFLNKLDAAIAKEDFETTIRLLEEFQKEPSLQESEKLAIAAAKNSVAETLVRKETPYQQVEATITQLSFAIKLRDVGRIPKLMDDLKHREIDLTRQYPSSESVSRLIERSQKCRRQGTGLILQVAFRGAIINKDVKKATETLLKIELLSAEDPAYAPLVPKLRGDFTKLKNSLSCVEQTASSGDKEKPPGEKRQISKPEPVDSNEQSAAVEERAKKAEGDAPEKTKVDLKALRKRVSNLYVEDPEKCFAFLDTMNADLIEDPVIRTYQQKAVQAWKERSSGIFAEKPSKRSGAIAQAKDVICPVCSMPNPTSNASCSQCSAKLIREPKPQVQKSAIAPDASPYAVEAGSQLMPRVPESEAAQPPIFQRSARQGVAKYYTAAAFGCLCLIVAGWWIANKPKDKIPETVEVKQEAPVQGAIGSAIVDEASQLLNGQKVVANLAPGSKVSIVENPASDLDAMVKIFYTDWPNKILNGTVKLRDLKYVSIDGNPDFTLKHLELKYPDLGSDPEKLRSYVQSTHEAITNLKSAKPGNDLLLKQARSYMQLARTVDREQPTARTDYENAKTYLSTLPDSLEDVAALKKQCEARLNPVPAAPKVSCAETLGRMEYKYNQAYTNYKNADFKGARQITDQMLRYKPAGCTSASEITSFRENQDKFQKLLEKLSRYGSNE
jgi:serine/threonine protein kinase